MLIEPLRGPQDAAQYNTGCDQYTRAAPFLLGERQGPDSSSALLRTKRQRGWATSFPRLRFALSTGAVRRDSRAANNPGWAFSPDDLPNFSAEQNLTFGPLEGIFRQFSRYAPRHPLDGAAISVANYADSRSTRGSHTMVHFSWWIDGSIVGLYLVATMIAGIMVRKYVGKVEHFLVAGREVNVYLGIASLAATEFGVITCMYTAQAGYKYGFAGATPGSSWPLAMFLVGVTGFCIKPLRDAGVMTIPELFEKRYGPRIRWAAGVVIVLGGLLNMGVFLRITGEFLVLVCGLRHLQYLETSPDHDDRAAAAGHDLHGGRRHALGAGHRLPPVHRDEHRADRRHGSDPGARSAGAR